MNTTIKGLFKENIFISMILKTYFDSFESHFCDIRHESLWEESNYVLKLYFRYWDFENINYSTFKWVSHKTENWILLS
jgi:hypothetical protein